MPSFSIFSENSSEGQALSAYLQCNKICILTDIFQKTFGLFLPDHFLCIFTGIVRCLFIRHLNDLQLAVAAQSLRIFRDRIPQILFLLFFQPSVRLSSSCSFLSFAVSVCTVMPFHTYKAHAVLLLHRCIFACPVIGFSLFGNTPNT